MTLGTCSITQTPRHDAVFLEEKEERESFRTVLDDKYSDILDDEHDS